ncbi:hypothetical protein GE061_019241 [Apolygus lucorum]|uniref:Uncharacterized protein n=1 Tax=Apolygus lucorum TaxID=248454 RepID=A0A6A4JWM7_APOLU|nr:hypothetical protein GE061_019241 [Apolygus lucorum]
MARTALLLLLVVKCLWGAAADYGGEYGDYDGDEGYYLEGNTKGESGYNHGDSYDKKAKDGYGYETHSEYGKGGDGDDENVSYESSHTYGEEEKPKNYAYSYSTSSGTPYDGPSYDGDVPSGPYDIPSYDGDYDSTKVKPKKVDPFGAVETPSRTYQALYNAPGIYDGPAFDVPAAYTSNSGVYASDASNVYSAAQDALRSVELLSKLAGPKYQKLFESTPR